MPNKRLIYLLYLICISFLPVCHKDGPTIIKGTVTNRITHEPTPALLQYGISDNNWQPGSILGKLEETDSNGQFLLEIPANYRVSLAAFTYTGKYLPYVDPARNLEIKIGETNIINAAMMPTDGFLRLNIQNDQATGDSVFVQFYNYIQELEAYLDGYSTLKNFPVILPAGGNYQEIIAVPSETITRIEWSTKHYPMGAVTPFRDSVFIARYDTVDFTIHY